VGRETPGGAEQTNKLGPEMRKMPWTADPRSQNAPRTNVNETTNATRATSRVALSG
jgi:hypothetical protein